MANERYHGSRLRGAAHAAWVPVRDGVLDLAHRFRPARDRVPPRVQELLDRVEAALDRFDWDAALLDAREAAAIVERDGNTRPKRLVGNKLLPLGDCGRGLRLLAEPLAFCAAREWQGEDLSGRRLFIRQLHTSNMGAPVRMARFVAHAVKMAAHCVVIVEPRLVPIFQRSFPEAEVRPLRFKWILDARRDDYVTSFEGLGGFLVSDWPSVARTFVPLKADERLTAELRSKYTGTSRGPLVGFSWGSKNDRKSTPPLSEWVAFVERFPATFLSLQYGPVAAALSQLREASSNRIIDDPSVDQLVDMDRFAAQVAAVDLVVTISNTGAHLAGALGKPVVLVMGDGGRGYPMEGRASAWYPNAVLVRRHGRDWNVTLREAESVAQEMLQSVAAPN